MLTRALHDELAAELKAFGYAVEEFKPKHSDILDIWHWDRSRGYVEITVCHAAPGHVVLCPVDYDSPNQDLVEILNGDVTPLVEQLNAFYA
jgi:hypothetical protein